MKYVTEMYEVFRICLHATFCEICNVTKREQVQYSTTEHKREIMGEEKDDHTVKE